jgi:hypothetical protein
MKISGNIALMKSPLNLFFLFFFSFLLGNLPTYSQLQPPKFKEGKCLDQFLIEENIKKEIHRWINLIKDEQLKLVGPGPILTGSGAPLKLILEDARSTLSGLLASRSYLVVCNEKGLPQGIGSFSTNEEDSYFDLDFLSSAPWNLTPHLKIDQEVYNKGVGMTLLKKFLMKAIDENYFNFRLEPLANSLSFYTQFSSNWEESGDSIVLKGKYNLREVIDNINKKLSK